MTVASPQQAADHGYDRVPEFRAPLRASFGSLVIHDAAASGRRTASHSTGQQQEHPHDDSNSGVESRRDPAPPAAAKKINTPLRIANGCLERNRLGNLDAVTGS